MEYKIMIDEFQGPMDLLLHLIDRAEIDIYDIPINKISEQFIEYIKSMDELNLDITSEFLIMAATLLEIKSKMLLPKEEKPEDDESDLDEEDPRDELVKRIVEYKKYKEAAKELKEYEELYSKMYLKPKEELIFDIEEDAELSGLKVEDLFKCFNKMMERNSMKASILEIDEIQREEYTLERCIETIKHNLKEEKNIRFSELFDSECISKPEIIAYFLSILELIASKYIGVRQENDFSDLFIFLLDEKEPE